MHLVSNQWFDCSKSALFFCPNMHLNSWVQTWKSSVWKQHFSFASWWKVWLKTDGPWAYETNEQNTNKLKPLVNLRSRRSYRRNISTAVTKSKLVNSLCFDWLMIAELVWGSAVIYAWEMVVPTLLSSTEGTSMKHQLVWTGCPAADKGKVVTVQWVKHSCWHLYIVQ